MLVCVHPSRLVQIWLSSDSDKNWASRLPIILLGLRARPHLDSGLSPHQLAFGCEITLPADFASKEAEELDGVDFYEQLKRARDGYEYPPAVHHQHDDGEASEALQKAKFVLVRQDGHKPLLAAAYKGYIESSPEAATAICWRGATPQRTG